MVDFCGWLFFGLIAGVIAKFLMGGEGPSGWFITIALGIVGAMLGGAIAQYFNVGPVTGFDIRSFAVAVGGSILVLIIYRLVALEIWGVSL